MPLNIKPPEQVLLEHEVETKIMEMEAEQAERTRDHEYRLAKLKISTQTRAREVGKVLLALVKIPVLPVVVICSTYLVAKGKEVPKAFTDYLSP